MSAFEGNSRTKPGVRTQFKKGQSGNPKGRPRKDRGSVRPLPAELAELVKSETERLLTLTDGGKPITISALQAVLRSAVVNAAKGNPHAQRLVLHLAETAQAQEAKARQDVYEQAILLKIHLEHDRDVWVARGCAEADMPRHPSDIEINRETGEVRNLLLFTREEIEARKRVIRMRDFLIEQMPQMLLALQEDGDDPFLEIGRESARAFIDQANAKLPSRFRRHLPGEAHPLGAEATPEEIWRSWASDLASVPCPRKPD